MAVFVPQEEQSGVTPANGRLNSDADEALALARRTVAYSHYIT